MALTLITLSLLLIALGLFQAWTLWYLKREVSRLDQRLDESLDDQDLLDFQERLQGLIQQARATGSDMVGQVERRQEALEKTLGLVREAEKALLARAHLLEKSADAMAQRAEKLKAEPAKAKAARRAQAPKSSPKPVAKPLSQPEALAEAPAPAAEQTLADQTPAEALAAAEARTRSYLVRQAAPAPVAPTGGRKQRVYELADQGLSRDQIARETGALPGEVELILNLRPRRRHDR
jgi:hypothetical protein